MKKRILLVDDDDHLRRMVGDFLMSEGFDVLQAQNGHEALTQIEASPPDLILLDIMMPRMDGGDVAQRVRDRPGTADIPIIYLTAAVSREEVRRHGGVIGGEQFIAKPVDPEELLRRVQVYLAG